MELADLLIFGLATWRVTSLFVSEAGPANIFRRVRELAGITHDENGRVVMIPDRFFAQLFSCVWCCSVWVGLFWFLAWLLFPKLSLYAAIPFALSAFAIWMDERNSRA